MAFNWDKLCKAQRDYPKPKFALDAINKLLKKRPKDPYVLAWQASVLLSQDSEPHQIVGTLLGLGRCQPPITDLPFLSYNYRLLAEALRRHHLGQALGMGSVGPVGLEAWQNAAKSAPNRNARLAIWSELFVVAMRQDCWDDVRFAVVQANKEGQAAKKVTYYSFILANQLSAEHSAKLDILTNNATMSSQIQFGVARQRLKDAFEGSTRLPDPAVRVSDMRDLRFMASIYQRQNRVKELFDLWSEPPEALRKMFKDHEIDILVLQTDIAKECKEWNLLAEKCMAVIDREMEPTGNIKHISSVAWSIWSNCVRAMQELNSEVESESRTMALLNAFQKKMPDIRRSRELQLTRIMLTGFSGQSVVQLAKEFWLDNYQRRTCFFDLRRIVHQFLPSQMKEFQSFIAEHARSRLPERDSESATREWLLAEASVLQFEYLLFISAVDDPKSEVVEVLAVTALKLYRIAEEIESEAASDVACVAVLSLLRLHKFHLELDDSNAPQLQAAMLLRHIFRNEKLGNSRQLALMSTRVHLNLGLGTIAFEHYGYAKIKEMLNDTTAWILLSRISQSHPFDAKGPRGFSADEELRKVIASIEKMETRTGDFLYKELQDFGFDTALDLIDFKQKARSSITKHGCMIERRRIARLKGITVDRQLEVDVKDYKDMSVNYDYSALPNFDFARDESLKLFIDPLPVTSMWAAIYYNSADVCARLIHKEPTTSSHRAMLDMLYVREFDREEEDEAEVMTDTENEFNIVMRNLKHIATTVYEFPSQKRAWTMAECFNDLFEDLDRIHDVFRRFIEYAPDSDPKDIRLFAEQDLMYSYGFLEVLQLLARFIPALRDITRQKTHPLHLKISKANVDKLQQKVNESYRVIMAGAQTDVDRLKRVGMKRIREEIHHGATGEALRGLISDRDLEAYGKEYIESALESYGAVLKVKLN